MTAPSTSPPHPPCTRLTRECDFWNWGEGSLRPACCTEHLLELTAFASELLARHGIVHWLEYGTLLGAVREGELIPWDGDVDFGVLARDDAAIRRLAGEVEAAGRRMDGSLPGVIRITYSDVNLSHVDLFPFAERDGVLNPQSDANFAWPGMAGRSAFPKRFVEPLGEVTLHGRSFPAPAPVEEFLRDHRYGPNWATPVRAIHSVKLYPSFDLSEMTPEAEQLLERIAAGDERLAGLRTSSRWAHHRAVEIWQKAGLPIRAARRYVDAVRAELPAGETTPIVETLTTSAALLDQAIDEFANPSLQLALRRMGRRGRRIAEVVRARLERRPHRAGFPFGAEDAQRPT